MCTSSCQVNILCNPVWKDPSLIRASVVSLQTSSLHLSLHSSVSASKGEIHLFFFLTLFFPPSTISFSSSGLSLHLCVTPLENIFLSSSFCSAPLLAASPLVLEVRSPKLYSSSARTAITIWLSVCYFTHLFMIT